MSLSVLVVLSMAAAWCLIVGEISLRQALLGLGFGTIFTLVTPLGRRRTVAPSRLPLRLAYLAFYVFLLVPYDIIRSNLSMARILLSPRLVLRPAIVRFRIESGSNVLAALLGHALTISPQDMVIEYSADCRTLYVHVIDVTSVHEKQARFWRLYAHVLEKILA